MASVSNDSDYMSRNPDTASTEAFSDPGRDPSSDSMDSDDDVEDDFLENFKCCICGGVPVYEQAVQVAASWVAGELRGLASWIMQPQAHGMAEMRRLMVYCSTCHSFYHAGCILTSGSYYAIAQMAELMVMKMEGYTPVQYLCHNCHNNMWLLMM